MSELVKLAPLQIRMQICDDFTKYFVEHINELITTESEQKLVNEWKMSDWGKFILQGGHQRIDLILEYYDGEGHLTAKYKAQGFCIDRFTTHEVDTRSMEIILYQYITSNLEFCPWYADWSNEGNIFKKTAIRKFLDTQYSPTQIKKWEKLGVQIYVDE